jgi:hypothetical protein
MDTPLKDQALDLIIRGLIEKGVKPYEIYESVSRVDPTIAATDEEVERVIALTEGRDDMVSDANPWVSRYDETEDDWPAVTWVHVWLRLED